MSVREIQEQKAIVREIYVPQTVHANGDVWASPVRGARPRIAFKAKGRILLLDLADILAVQAEGNYVSLRSRTNLYLVHESLSAMAEKLKPYGFMRIHRSVVVNISAVEEIQPLATGEYGLRVKGGKEYLVTRKYKHNLRELAQLWVGAERLSGEPATRRAAVSP